MNEKHERVASLLQKTKTIYQDCMMPNGAIVGSPGHMPYFPVRTHKSYLFVWPGRDAGFALTAGLETGIDQYEQFIDWLWERAESFQGAPTHLADMEGILLRSYFVNGGIRENAFQPDQNATLLWALSVYKDKRSLTPRMEDVARKLADGLIASWQSDHFTRVVEDLWEERIAHPAFKTNLTYTLAACSTGLSFAGKLLSNKQYLQAAEEMEALVNGHAYSSDMNCFLRRFGADVRNQKVVDASLLGLIWPFDILGHTDERITNTVEAIEEKLLVSEGVQRYEFDEYEGEVEAGVHYKQGAGAWPLLTFWLAIAQSKLGNTKKADEYFWSVLDRLDDSLLIPEQLFPETDPRIGIKPLLWSHAMFVHAARELGYLEAADN